MRPTAARLNTLTSCNGGERKETNLYNNSIKTSKFKGLASEPATHLKNRSPGYCMYMTSRFVHCVSPLLRASPLIVPPNTPIMVRMVSKFFRMNPRKPPLRSVIVHVCLGWSRALPGLQVRRQSVSQSVSRPADYRSCYCDSSNLGERERVERTGIRIDSHNIRVTTYSRQTNP